jgi:hypothetical protein
MDGTMSKTLEDFWQWMYDCPVGHKINEYNGSEMTLTFFFEVKNSDPKPVSPLNTYTPYEEVDNEEESDND